MSTRVTLYDVLGVRQDATEDEIRAAFRQLTIKYHPDRYPPDRRADAETRFQEITEAFNVLGHPGSRDRYDKELSLGTDEAKKRDPREIAQRLAARGAQEFKNGNLVEAREHLELAIHHDETNSRAHYFLGMTLLRLPDQQGPALRHLDRAVQLEPDNLAMKVETARAFEANGMALRARRLAADVLAVDRTNQRAGEILARLEKKEKQPSQSDGGLLGRLKRRG